MNGPPRNRLTLVLGPANSGKMGHVLRWWAERLAQKAVVVAPTGPDAQELSLEMARRTGGLVGQSPAVTFEGLVRLLLRRPPRYATDLERALIAARLLRQTPLEALESAVHLPGTATALSTLLQQLGESGRTPEDLDRVLARWAVADPRSAPLAGDVGRLLRAYEDTCADLGLVDRPAAVREATRAAEGWTRPVALYGFTSFTPGQRALVEELSRDVEVLVVFTHDRSRAVNLSTPAEISRWESRAAEVVEVAPSNRAYTSPAVAYLERYLMDDAARPEPPLASSGSEGVRFLLASGQRAEAELAAEQITDLIRAGVRPRDIAVVVRQMRKWSGLLGHVFDSCGIPYQMDDRCVLGETGLGHAFLSALRGVAFDDPAAILAYLRSPYSEVSLEDVSDLELRYRRGTAKGARILAGIAKDMGIETVDDLWRMVDSDAGDVRAGLDAGSRGAVGSWFDPVVGESLGRCMLTAGLRGSAVGNVEAEEDARAFRALRAGLSAITSLASAPGRTPMPGAESLHGARRDRGRPGSGDGLPGWPDPQLVLRALAQLPVPGGRSEGVDGVQVLSVQRARARRFEVVVVLGLVEGEFPGRPGTASLLSTTQRARLDAMADGLLTPEVDQEGAFFVSAVSRAWQLLLLSARDAEDDGSESTPSRFWEAAKELLGVGEDGHESRTLADQVYALDRAPSLRHYLRACAIHGRAPDPATTSRRGALVPVRPWGRRPCRLTAPAVLSELAAARSFSPSALEAYARCPFKWFMERVIGAEDLELELDGRQIGQLLHSVLSMTYSELASAGVLPLRPDGLPMAERVAFAIVDDLVEGEDCPGTLSERRLAAWRLKRMARNLFGMEVSANGTLVLSQTETWVGGREGVDIGGISIRGRIDRIDVTRGGDALFVFDYKTGAIPAAGAIGTDEGLQLPLYLMALAAERPEAEVIGGAYLSLLEKKRAGVVMSGAEAALGSGVQGCRILGEEAAEELFRATREVAQEAASGMRAGNIAPRADRRCPSWCRLGPACRARRAGHKP